MPDHSTGGLGRIPLGADFRRPSQSGFPDRGPRVNLPRSDCDTPCTKKRPVSCAVFHKTVQGRDCNAGASFIVDIGVHFHNNQQLAFANTIEGIIKNANYVDGTLMGLGRGAGNCPLELLVAFLKNPKFRILPLIEGASKAVLPLEKTVRWGYHIPYMVTGMLNRHPLPAMQWLEEDEPGDYAEFYRKIVADTE